MCSTPDGAIRCVAAWPRRGFGPASSGPMAPRGQRRLQAVRGRDPPAAEAASSWRLFPSAVGRTRRRRRGLGALLSVAATATSPTRRCSAFGAAAAKSGGSMRACPVATPHHDGLPRRPAVRRATNGSQRRLFPSGNWQPFVRKERVLSLRELFSLPLGLAVFSRLTIWLLLFAFYALGFRPNMHDRPSGLAELHNN